MMKNLTYRYIKDITTVGRIILKRQLRYNILDQLANVFWWKNIFNIDNEYRRIINRSINDYKDYKIKK